MSSEDSMKLDDSVRRSTRARKPIEKLEQEMTSSSHQQRSGARAAATSKNNNFPPSTLDHLASMTSNHRQTPSKKRKSSSSSAAAAAVTPSSAVKKPRRGCSAKLSSSTTTAAAKNKKSKSAATASATKTAPKNKNKLSEVAKSVHSFIESLPEDDKTIQVGLAAQDLGVQKRRLYDVMHVLEGCGLVKPVCSAEGRNQSDYRWLPQTVRRREPSLKERIKQQKMEEELEAEEEQLDEWIAVLTEMTHEDLTDKERANNGLYLSSNVLKRHLFKHHQDSFDPQQFVAISLLEDDVMTEVDTSAVDGTADFQLVIRPGTMEPWEWADVPEGFAMRGVDEPLGYLAFAPPPPMLGQPSTRAAASLGELGIPCTSDFSATALTRGLSWVANEARNEELNLHGGAVAIGCHRQSSLGTWSSKDADSSGFLHARQTSYGTWSSKEDDRYLLPSPQVSWGSQPDECLVNDVADLGLIPLLLRASTSVACDTPTDRSFEALTSVALGC